jgi:hypothetical protein
LDSLEFYRWDGLEVIGEREDEMDRARRAGAKSLPGCRRQDFSGIGEFSLETHLVEQPRNSP